MESHERKIIKSGIADAKPLYDAVQSKTQAAYKDIKKETVNRHQNTTHPHSTPKHTANPEREYLPEPQGTQDFAK